MYVYIYMLAAESGKERLTTICLAFLALSNSTYICSYLIKWQKGLNAIAGGLAYRGSVYDQYTCTLYFGVHACIYRHMYIHVHVQ